MTHINNEDVSGILSNENEITYLLGDDGQKYFESDPIWEGYCTHWLGKKVWGRLLPQKDYVTDKSIVIMWPHDVQKSDNYIELYFNERLVKYAASITGHTAININGEIYNYSHKLNENEIMTEEEYFYRPALGEFGPSPNNGKFEVLADGKAYYDKFGRSFMRTIHVIRVEGLDTGRLKAIFDHELQVIRETPVNPNRPEKYADFSVFNRSCSTIIRDGLNEYGFHNIDGIFPRDLYISTAYEFKINHQLDVEIYQKPQLLVPEAPKSAMAPYFSLKNIFKIRELSLN